MSRSLSQKGDAARRSGSSSRSSQSPANECHIGIATSKKRYVRVCGDGLLQLMGEELLKKVHIVKQMGLFDEGDERMLLI